MILKLNNSAGESAPKFLYSCRLTVFFHIENTEHDIDSCTVFFFYSS